MKFKIDKVNVYGIEETTTYSGLPMSIDDTTLTPDLERLAKLGNTQIGAGHDCALKGIVVQANITAPQYWWPQFQRYHFADIVSSQSKMHKLTKMNLEEQCNEYVTTYAKKLAEKVIDQYTKDPSKRNFQVMMSNVPMGLVLTARITTNYLQLKNIYSQRRLHKLEEWQQFCKWCLTLPNFKKLIGIEEVKVCNKN